jgi:transcriptional regulator with GAF, ATPase, and Fis domain
MNPRLVGLHGPLKGQVVEFIDGQLSIGRDHSNSVCIREKSVSRSHAVIRQDSGRVEVVDLGSQNGTFVNGSRVHEQRVLEAGDQVRIGQSMFAFVVADEVPAQLPCEVQLDEVLTTRSEIRLRQEDSLYANTVTWPSVSPVTDRVAHDLKALLAICADITAIVSPDFLQRRLLESIVEVIPADTGAVLLLKDGSHEEFVSRRGWSKLSMASEAVHVSQNVILRVAREQTALLSNDVGRDGDLGHDSLVRRNVQSVLAVPIRSANRMMGVIYLEALDPDARFDANHLQFVVGVAGIAGIAIENARQVESLQSENRRLNAEMNMQHSMVGESAPMLELYRVITKVASTDATVLLLGESGTGKELAARAIHFNSPRAQHPFLALNCAALTESLLESELFGHEKGSFTGAIAQKKGKIEVAEGGTLFLDEVGELAPSLQAKLLRVLQEREFDRVGGTKPIQANVRLIAATNRNLEQATKDGGFRHDLYFRLNVVSLTVPPLRERREDIPLLANHFTAELAKKVGRRVKGISAEARQSLAQYDWPGNVRELQNAIERAIVLGTTEYIMPDDLPEFLRQSDLQARVEITDYHQALKETKRQLVLKVLRQANGNYTNAAKLLGIHPNNLHRLIRELNLKLDLKKQFAKTK